MEHFRFATASHICVDKVDLCSALGDFNAEECKISNEIAYCQLFTSCQCSSQESKTLKYHCPLIFGSAMSNLIVKNADLILL